MGSVKELSTQEENIDSSFDQPESGELVALTEPKMNRLAPTMWNDVELFKTTQRMAQLLLASDTIPQGYKGKLSDCVVAIDMANRMGVSPLVIMQNSQIVRGNFSWKGTACKAMIDGCGKYKDSYYVEVGERGKDTWGYYLEAIDKRGRVIKGCVVDMAMAKSEGWYQKDGSKWKTMPELMLKYRAAAFFFRTECASLAMGFLTTEEQEDIEPYNGGANAPVRAQDEPQEVQDEDDEEFPPESYKCAACGKVISKKLFEQSLKKYGTPLCSAACRDKVIAPETEGRITSESAGGEK